MNQNFEHKPTRRENIVRDGEGLRELPHSEPHQVVNGGFDWVDLFVFVDAEDGSDGSRTSSGFAAFNDLFAWVSRGIRTTLDGIPRMDKVEANELYDKLGVMLDVMQSRKVMEDVPYAVPIFEAARSGRLDRVKTGELRAAVTSSVSASGVTPLHVAATYGHLEVVRAFCSVCPSQIHNSQCGFSPFQAAVQEGHTNVVNYFLEIGGDTAYIFDLDFRGRGVLELAALLNRVDIIELLIGSEGFAVAKA